MARVPLTIDNRFLSEVHEAVLRYGRSHFGASGLPLEDLAQEAMLTAFEKVHDGSLTRLTSSLKTYIIGIFKKKALEALRERDKMTMALNLPNQDDDDVPEPIVVTVSENTGSVTSIPFKNKR